MSERIVDVFELVDVQEEHGESFAELVHLEDRMIRAGRQTAPGSAARQQVVICLVLDGLFGALSLGDVAIDPPVAFQRPGSIEERDAARFHDYPASLLVKVGIFEQ